MNGLMMDYPLTLSTIFRRAETIYQRREIVSRLADKSIHRYTMGEFAHRARKLAPAEPQNVALLAPVAITIRIAAAAARR